MPAETIAQSQRDRLQRSVLELAARDGYASVTVTGIVAWARVSRETYYAHYADKQAVFVAAIAAFEATLGGPPSPTNGHSHGAGDLQSLLTELTGRLAQQPAATWCLLFERPVWAEWLPPEVQHVVTGLAAGDRELERSIAALIRGHVVTCVRSGRAPQLCEVVPPLVDHVGRLTARTSD